MLGLLGDPPGTLAGVSNLSREPRAGDSSVLAQDGSRTIPDPVIDAMLPRDLCAAVRVGSKATPGSNHDGGRLAARSIAQPLNEVSFSRNDFTYDVGR